ncbi:putative E3 ubiquitin-protein ligase ARI9 [Acorus calamus]|uniref:E3 ubiquitin-protein ligase ARI9 n=1 Tax=Acorus calamus TaxID=4465 RepID=A0AAV9CIC5_ACOCL|nr:putative E3 ubiquitin-protein ligase ARI9 [Acorus calamus]
MSKMEFVNDDGPFEVTCACSHRFCWNCCEEAHRPVDCGTAAKWAAKNLDEAQNVGWWLPLNPKACPKCGTPIEKRDGCMRVACAHEFCWLCLREWSAHGSPCNGFEDRRQRRAVPRSRWMVARVSSERYVDGDHREEEEEGKKKKKKRGLFEFLQGASETELERLHKLAEVDEEGRCEGFLDFCEETVNLTRVTRSYLENLVHSVENRLEM